MLEEVGMLYTTMVVFGFYVSFLKLNLMNVFDVSDEPWFGLAQFDQITTYNENQRFYIIIIDLYLISS